MLIYLLCLSPSYLVIKKRIPDNYESQIRQQNQSFTLSPLDKFKKNHFVYITKTNLTARSLVC